ncbi:MAG TPA: rhodanese-like domain-containing protein [Syntrophorhabdaceae bacterium]|nr:rhodanese-like domain-containing protein [Syntrophorhabdaceae bacterium]
MPSAEAAFAARNIGYSNVMVLYGGYPEWVRRGYEIER